MSQACTACMPPLTEKHCTAIKHFASASGDLCNTPLLGPMDSAEAQPETLRGACRGVQRHLGDAKFVTKILEGGGKEVRGGKFTSLFQGKISAWLNRLNSQTIYWYPGLPSKMGGRVSWLEPCTPLDWESVNYNPHSKGIGLTDVSCMGSYH